MFPTIKAEGKTATPSRVSFAATVSIDLEAKSADGSRKMATFKIRGYTGAVMNVMGYYMPVIVDLGGIKAESETIPALLDHDTSQIVGQTNSVSISSEGVDLAGIITGEDAPAEKVRTHARNGFLWQASIGASIVRQESLKAGEKAQVNGREVTGPLLIARESRLFEISFVALGADSQTSAAVAAKVPSGSMKGAPTMFEQWLQAKGIDPAGLDDNTRNALQASFNAEEAAKKAAAAAAGNGRSGGNGNPGVVGGGDRPGNHKSISEIAAEVRAEQFRVSRIEELSDAFLAERHWLVDDVELIAQAAVDGKATVEEFEVQLLRIRANAGTSTPSRRSSRRTEARSGPKVIEAAVCLAGMIEQPGKSYDQATLNAAEERFPHGIGLQDLLLMSARENGYTGNSPRDVRGMLEFAFRRDIRAEFSTMSLPGILSNVANKFLLQGFNAVEDGWRMIAKIKPVKDLKTNTSYALTGDMEYAQLGPTGELKHGTVGEQAYTNKANIYGKMFTITMEAIINDDLGALTEIPMKLGRGAALKLNKVFWTTFLSNANTFFTAGQGNLSTGAGSALSSAGLQAAQTKFRKQTDPDGNPLGLSPKILLVPVELEVTADELMTALIVNTGGASTEAKVPNKNVWANKFTTVSSSYLSNANITGYSAAKWYLLTDPADLAAIEVCFLNGRETPVVEQADADFNVLGIQMRGYHAFGAGQQEYRAVVRSDGS